MTKTKEVLERETRRARSDLDLATSRIKRRATGVFDIGPKVASVSVVAIAGAAGAGVLAYRTARSSRLRRSARRAVREVSRRVPLILAQTRGLLGLLGVLRR